MTQNDQESQLNKSLEKLASHLERSQITEYIQLLNRPLRLIWLNFVAGLARGFGIAIGMTLIVAVGAYMLSRLLNLPVIGYYIAQLVEIVQQHMQDIPVIR